MPAMRFHERLLVRHTYTLIEPNLGTFAIGRAELLSEDPLRNTLTIFF